MCDKCTGVACGLGTEPMSVGTKKKKRNWFMRLFGIKKKKRR